MNNDTGNRWNSGSKRDDIDDWLISYADMVTLLLAFFAVLLSISHFDMVKFEQVQSGVGKDIGKRETAQPIQDLKNEIEATLVKLSLKDDQAKLGTDDRGLVLEFDANTFFDSGSARLKEEHLPALVEIGQRMNGQRYSAFLVEVQGHTDDTPIASQVYPTNWELSAARASAVVRLFIQIGMAPTRLTATGFADTRPKVSNRDIESRPLPRNQAINRRVTIHVFPR